ncbi:MAG: anaerobic ribonucleoside-triphosphate reductase activating protein [Muribaculaceae bacterium]|nr:anaerobic ribonucleoside-triphosphate reductase activating protein [Muribaculaceae bacterium]
MNSNQITFNVLDIRRGTTVDGPGLRTSIYLAGCRHACPGCHNPDSWDFNAGSPMTLEEILRVVDDEDFDVTLSGGDPLMHPDTLPILIHAIKERGKNVWVYTGYTIEQIEADPKLWDAVKEADTIVDGPFMRDLRDPDLLFRGSSNQRIIDLHKRRLHTT